MGRMMQILEQMLAALQRLEGRTPCEGREILDINQAAAYLGQSVHTLRDWIRLRKVPYFKVNGAVKFRKSKLDKWIDRGEIPMQGGGS